MRAIRKQRGRTLQDVSDALLAKHASDGAARSGWSLKSLQRREVDTSGRYTTIEDFEAWCAELGVAPMVAAVDPASTGADNTIDLGALTESQRAVVRRLLLLVGTWDRNQRDAAITMFGVIEGHHKIL